LKENNVQQRSLGGDVSVSSIGLGCMGMSQSYGSGDDVESTATIEAALDAGMNFLDTADIYGMGKNEALVGRAIANRRDSVFLATKFGNAGVAGPEGAARGVDGRPEYVKQACADSLRRLGTDYIDLYYQHRVDPLVPIEETWGALGELVAEGKVRYLGISEAAPDTVRRAHATAPISASQNEYSLWSRDPEDGLLDTLRELGIALVAYSPIGRGFLSGTITSPDQFEADDNRRNHPRFQGANFDKNLELGTKITSLAKEKGVTPSQLAIAWVLAQGDDVIPIPGTKRRSYLFENLAATEVTLSAEDLRQIEELAPKGSTAGDRYPAAQMARINL
jgi:aryl-alcohol dehydrogenase-like predicted oxidoreductase